MRKQNKKAITRNFLLIICLANFHKHTNILFLSKELERYTFLRLKKSRSVEKNVYIYSTNPPFSKKKDIWTHVTLTWLITIILFPKRNCINKVQYVHILKHKVLFNHSEFLRKRQNVLFNYSITKEVFRKIFCESNFWKNYFVCFHAFIL